jgi:hypothetical protein
MMEETSLGLAAVLRPLYSLGRVVGNKGEKNPRNGRDWISSLPLAKGDSVKIKFNSSKQRNRIFHT